MISVLRRLRGERGKFEGSLVYILEPCLKQQQPNKQTEDKEKKENEGLGLVEKLTRESQLRPGLLLKTYQLLRGF